MDCAIERPEAPFSSDKLLLSGSRDNNGPSPNDRDCNLAHGSSTGSTTISEACAIAAESNFGKFSGSSGFPPKGEKEKDHNARNSHPPKVRHHGRNRTSARSHSAGVVTSHGKLAPISNNLSSSSSRPQLPVLKHSNKSISPGVENDSVMRAIQTATVASRLPPISNATALESGTPGSYNPGSNISPIKTKKKKILKKI